MIHKYEKGDVSAGYCSKDLLYCLIRDINNRGGQAGVFYVSPEDLDDIREYHDPANEQIFETFLAGKYWDVPICVAPELKGTGVVFALDLERPALISFGLIERLK